MDSINRTHGRSPCAKRLLQVVVGQTWDEEPTYVLIVDARAGPIVVGDSIPELSHWMLAGAERASRLSFTPGYGFMCPMK